MFIELSYNFATISHKTYCSLGPNEHFEHKKSKIGPGHPYLQAGLAQQVAFWTPQVAFFGAKRQKIRIFLNAFAGV